MLTVEKIDLEDVKKFDKEKYNSNNHWIDNIKPHDYNYINKLTDTQNWINLFKKSYTVVNFDSVDINILKSMYNVCLLKNEISKIYDDEIEFLNKKYSFVDNYLAINGGQFIRFENVSIKYGKHGCVPYTSFTQILESMLTSPIGHTPIYEGITELRMYIIPWNSHLDVFKEFRVFVYKNNITAISQQHLYSSNELLKEDTTIIPSLVHTIQTFFDERIKYKIKDLDCYSYDFAILDNGQPYFIEINPFGKEYSSGSSLFHWLIDEDKLYNDGNTIYFRFCV